MMYSADQARGGHMSLTSTSALTATQMVCTMQQGRPPCGSPFGVDPSRAEKVETVSQVTSH
eukprot:7308604-Pyramimonas_sp.AAC.1